MRFKLSAIIMDQLEEVDNVSSVEHTPKRFASLDSKETEQLQHPLCRASNLSELINLIDDEVFYAIEQLIVDSPELAAECKWMCL